MSDTGYSNYQPGQAGPPPLVGPGGYGLAFGQQSPLATGEYLMTTNRPSSEWGKPDIHLDNASGYPGVDPSPHMPRPSMFNGIMQSAARVPWSSNSIGSATHSMYFLAAYYKEKRANQLAAARLSAANFALQVKQFSFQNAKEMAVAHDLLKEFEDDPKKDVGKLKDQFQRLYFSQFKDPVAQDIFDNNSSPFKALNDLFNMRDTTVLNMNKAISQNGKANEDDSIFGPTIGGDTSDNQDQQQNPSQQTPAEQQQPTDAGAGTAAPPPLNAPPSAPGAAAAPSAPSAPSAAPAAAPAAAPLRPAPGITPPPATAVPAGTTLPPESANPPPDAEGYGVPASVYSGVRPNSDLAGLPAAPVGVYDDARTQLAGAQSRIPQKDAKARALSGAIYGRMRSKIYDIANSGMSAQTALRRFYAIDSGLAERARQIANNDQAMPSVTGMSSATMAPTVELLGAMVHKLNPGWDATQFKFKQDYKNPNGKTQQAFTSADRLNSTSIRLKQQIDLWRKKAGPNATIPQAVLTRMGTNLFGTDAADAPYKGLNAAWLAFARESVRVQNMGNPEVTPPLQITDLVSGAATPWAMYTILSNEANADVGAYEASNDNWKLNMRTTSDGPGYQADKYGVLKALGSNLKDTGRITGRVPPALVPYAYPDLPTAQDQTNVQWAYQHPNDPVAKRIFHDYHIDQ
jgi:hypothetical protein